MPVLYYVRHGETDFNVEARLQGRSDIPLNPHGRQQAANSGALLRDLFARDHKDPADLAYVASPLKRARETMEILRGTLGLDPNTYAIDDRLVEISYGDWEGFTLPEIDARTPGVMAQRERDKWGFAPPGGESYRELTQRISAWYAALTRDTVAAAHGGGVRALMTLINAMPPEEATRAPIAQGGVYVFADGKMTLYP
ncbi:MAG TPA: histidine phosphatase family protein [Xanthobacteraceae bacterium]|jgi:probable phosphoglycerate mutase|nr:histidine phosphatase family protein [Xanthobacteraceae bacterium]